MEIARYWDPPVLTVDLTCEPPRGKQAMPACLALSATHKSCSSSPWAQGDSARVRELQEGDANEWHAEVTKRRVLPGTEDNRWFSVGTKMSLFPHETTTWMKKKVCRFRLPGWDAFLLFKAIGFSFGLRARWNVFPHASPVNLRKPVFFVVLVLILSHTDNGRNYLNVLVLFLH